VLQVIAVASVGGGVVVRVVVLRVVIIL